MLLFVSRLSLTKKKVWFAMKQTSTIFLNIKLFVFPKFKKKENPIYSLMVRNTVLVLGQNETKDLEKEVKNSVGVKSLSPHTYHEGETFARFGKKWNRPQKKKKKFHKIKT